MGSRDHLFKVLVVGDAAVGKTSLVQRYCQDSFSKHYKSTVGVDFALKVLQWSDSEIVRLQLWDIAGQERFTSMTRLYYRDASACVIMFDVTNATTFSNSQRWKQDLDSKLTLPNGEPVPCLLLANKCDLSPWAVSRDQIDRFSKENGFTGWTETSVKENKNINEAMSTFELSPDCCPGRRPVVTWKRHLGPMCISASPGFAFDMLPADVSSS
ncbi:ras-related protein Rab-7L1 isoform X1 [Saimiri boliviensis]|uniref:ras-related protein Rab-7L1 isoform X1 n=1 Tax=Saimiri boliviensis TaxID=27679 RepID=UPI000533CFDA|nr:ras-related protein Rab-7L1 isoform X1 [Saimiri boliviensis boliviensis]XP_010347283.1 ras-related protein Rab-7L1 isoform X1 [Saimiri boliviensis boliviensis]XP_010347284.1 ras-related protein Rab-7L1 isoform X1 [Saimiri boliviensis boliviensis]XP_010347286.1 ras-related protein Rab-7L1 isoform X1 [Saimiri boliviensis boliviensis]